MIYLFWLIAVLIMEPPFAVQAQCERSAPVHVAFIWDGSHKTNSSNFDYIRRYFASICLSLPAESKIGAWQDQHKLFDLGQYNDNVQAAGVLRKWSLIPTVSVTLRRTLTSFWKDIKKWRSIQYQDRTPQYQQWIILITNGRSQDIAEDMAMHIKNQEWKIVTVGIDEVNSMELTDIATKGSWFYQAEDFQMLDDIFLNKILKNTLCSVNGESISECPFVPTPDNRPDCNWKPSIDEQSSCTFGWICLRPESLLSKKCPKVALPTAALGCIWKPVVSPQTRCVLSYTCGDIWTKPNACPEKKRPRPRSISRSNCKFIAIRDKKSGCIEDYECIKPGGENWKKLPYGEAGTEHYFREQNCDPDDTYACTGWREPMKWGCCWARAGRFYKYTKSGCYCDAIQRSCVIDRFVQNELEWSYCMPKQDFDCYWQFWLKANTCPPLKPINNYNFDDRYH